MKQIIFAGLMLASSFTHAATDLLAPVTVKLIDCSLHYIWENDRYYNLGIYVDSNGSHRDILGNPYIEITPANIPCPTARVLPEGINIVTIKRHENK